MNIGLYFQTALQDYLNQDMPWGDVTSEDSGCQSLSTFFEIKSHSRGIVCGLPFAEYLLRPVCERFSIICHEGQAIVADLKVLDGEGNGGGLLNRERLVLNLMMRLSGIATMTQAMVNMAKPIGIEICATRKTTPGFGLFEKYAVTVGGGLPHRMNLSEAYLIKNNHISVCGGIESALKIILKNRRHHLKLIVEVRNLDDLKTAVDFGVDIVLCDHFKPNMIQEAVTITQKTPTRIELSGNINLSNLKEYLIPGVSYISSGALTHQTSALDFSLHFLGKK